MKFPLPVRPFAPLQLTHEEKHTFAQLTDDLLHQTLQQYEQTLYEANGTIDPQQWKLIKKRRHVGVYQERTKTTLADPLLQSIISESHETERPASSPSLLWFGTIPGTLNDFMYGVVNPTTEIMKVKSSYVPDNIADCQVLASIIEATPTEPFTGVQLKWCVNGGPYLVRQVIRYRDFVYIEATGITRSSMGERIGYHIVQTLELPGVPQLHEYNFVRATMSLYHLFRQKEERDNSGVLEIYVRARMDFLGDLPQSVALFALTEGVISLSHAHIFAEMKKLNWLVKTKKKFKSTAISTSNTQPCFRACCVCQKNVKAHRSENYKKFCYVCMNRVCKGCRIVRKLSFLAPITRNVVQQNMTFCSQCMATALHTDGMLVASDELARDQQQKNEMYELESITDSCSRASSSSINSIRWG